MHIQIITRMIVSKSKPADINQTISFLKMRVLTCRIKHFGSYNTVRKDGQTVKYE